MANEEKLNDKLRRMGIKIPRKRVRNPTNGHSEHSRYGYGQFIYVDGGSDSSTTTFTYSGPYITTDSTSWYYGSYQ